MDYNTTQLLPIGINYSDCIGKNKDEIVSFFRLRGFTDIKEIPALDKFANASCYDVVSVSINKTAVFTANINVPRDSEIIIRYVELATSPIPLAGNKMLKYDPDTAVKAYQRVGFKNVQKIPTDYFQSEKEKKQYANRVYRIVVGDTDNIVHNQRFPSSIPVYIYYQSDLVNKTENSISDKCNFVFKRNLTAFPNSNLIIEYDTKLKINGFPMTIQSDVIGKVEMTEGDIKGFMFPTGQHEIRFMAGWEYRRTVFTSSDAKEPVYIKVTFDGLKRAGIEVYQPDYKLDETLHNNSFANVDYDSFNRQASIKLCTKCGSYLNSNDKFCGVCGAVAARTVNNDARNGKCPFCGAIISRLDGFCPSCGNELNKNTVNESLSDFATRINKIENDLAYDRKARDYTFVYWTTARKIWYIIFNIATLCLPWFISSWARLANVNKPNINLQQGELKKAELIANFPFTNTRESIVEAMSYFQEKVHALSNKAISPRSIYWMNCWETKCNQIYSKSQIVLGNDQFVNEVHSDIVTTVKNAKNRAKKTAVSSFVSSLLVIIVAVSTIVISSVVSTTVSNNKYNEQLRIISDYEDAKIYSADDIAVRGWLNNKIDIQEATVFYDENVGMVVEMNVKCIESPNDYIEAVIEKELKNNNIDSDSDYQVAQSHLSASLNNISASYISSYTYSYFMTMYTQIVGMKEGEERVISISIPIDKYNIDEMISFYECKRMTIEFTTEYKLKIGTDYNYFYIQ